MNVTYTLNLGCGMDNWGNVRMDLHKYSLHHKKKTAANIIGDAHCLPFIDKSFTIARCFHVLEHCDNPNKVIEEIRKVSKKSIVRVPIWHFYSFLGEVLTLFLYVCLFKPKLTLFQLKEISSWKERYGEHKWYIRFTAAKINRQYWLPKEYEIIF